MSMRACGALLLTVIVPACSKPKGEPIQFPDDCGMMGFEQFRGPSRCAKVGEDTHVGMKLVGDELLVALGNHIGGTEFTVNKQTGTDGKPLLHIKVGDELAKLTIAQVKGEQPVDFHLTLTVDIPHHGVSTAPVPPMKVGRDVVESMRAAADHPIKLAGESDAAPAKHTVLFVPENAWDAEIDGPAQKLADIDWVAVARRGEKKTVTTCSYMSDRGAFTVPYEGYDETVVIYERKTHKMIDQMAAPAYAEDCPSSASSGETSFEAKNDYKPIKAWLAERVTK